MHQIDSMEVFATIATTINGKLSAETLQIKMICRNWYLKMALLSSNSIFSSFFRVEAKLNMPKLPVWAFLFIGFIIHDFIVVISVKQ